LPQLEEAEAGERVGLALAVADLAVHLKGLFQMAKGHLDPPLEELDEAEVGERPGLSGYIRGLPVQDHGLLVVVGGFGVAALANADRAEVFQRAGLGGFVAGAACHPAGDAVNGDRLQVMSPDVQVAEQRCREPRGVPGPAVFRRVLGNCDQVRSLGVKPRQRAGLAGEHRDGGGRCRKRWPAAALGGERRVHRRPGGVQVVIEQAGQRGPLFLRAVFGTGQLAGVATQQVVHSVPGRAGALDQAGPGQHLQRAARLAGRHAGTRRRGPRSSSAPLIAVLYEMSA
jgi:hypothetical protein